MQRSVLVLVAASLVFVPHAASAQANDDARSSRSSVGTVTGHWVSGLALSAFAPCPLSELTASSDTGMIWLNWSRAAASKIRWPKEGVVTMKDDRGKSVAIEGLSEFFVRIHGTLSGPGTFGHKGMATYELTADSLIEISTPTASDCSRARRPSAHQH